MKYLRYYKVDESKKFTKDELKAFLDANYRSITNATITKEGKVNADDVYFHLFNFRKEKVDSDDVALPFEFGEVQNDFMVISCELTKLEGCPSIVGRRFSCVKNRIETLVGGPKQVGGDYFSHGNRISSLEGIAEEIGGSIKLHSNRLTSLCNGKKGYLPEQVQGDLILGFNRLISLEGSPKIVTGEFNCVDNLLTSFIGGPVHVGTLNVLGNPITSLKGAPHVVNGRVLIGIYSLSEFLKNFFLLNGYRDYEPSSNDPEDFMKWSEWQRVIKYVFEWQDEYYVWREDGTFNQRRFILMMQDAELGFDIRFP